MIDILRSQRARAGLRLKMCFDDRQGERCAGGGAAFASDLAQSKVFALRQRAQIVLASDARSSAPEIARVLQTDENQVRRVIAEFNADGMASLRPRIGGGRLKRIDDAAREKIRGIALAPP